MFIAIEGNIGVGKTSMSKRVSNVLGCDLLLEKFEENPYLTQFYENKDLHAYNTEIWFLNSRFKFFSNIRLKENEILIGDHIFEKTYWFAKENLAQEIFPKFYSEYCRKSENILRPDLLFVMQLPVEELEKNIKKRGRDNELQIESNYLHKLNKIYKELSDSDVFKEVIFIEMENASDVSYEKAFQRIIEKIARTLK